MKRVNDVSAGTNNDLFYQIGIITRSGSYVNQSYVPIVGHVIRFDTLVSNQDVFFKMEKSPSPGDARVDPARQSIGRWPKALCGPKARGQQVSATPVSQADA